MLTRTNRRRFVGGASALAAASVISPAMASSGHSPATHAFRAQDAMEITAIRFTYGAPPPSDGPGLQMINERFNVDYKPQLVPHASYQEKISTQVAGGDVPDMMVFQRGDSNFYRWADDGAFVELSPYIEDYETFQYVDEDSWNFGRTADGLFGIPQYYPPYSLTPSIRKDWLDNLGLAVPTTYDELREVARAFTEDDPTGQGRRTQAFAMSQGINPNFAMGAYWNPGSWYHKDDQGRYVPGWATDAVKEHIAFLTDMYAMGAVTRDFAVMDWAAGNKEFYGGSAGIFIGAPRGMSQEYYAGLKAIDPEAVCVPIPPFEAPDGSQYYASAATATAFTAISAENEGDDERIHRMLELINVGRIFVPLEEQTPDNEHMDWLYGGEGEGYDMVDGRMIRRDNNTEPAGLDPTPYLMDGVPWPPEHDLIDYQAGYTTEPEMGEWAGALQDMWGEYGGYNDPTWGVISETQQQQGSELSQFLNDEMTKVIVGQRPIDDYDAIIEEWKQMGGEQVIEETNAGIAAREG